jgi:hypothetical protein
VIRARGREDGDGEVCERARASVWLFGAASFGTEVRERLALVRAHLINRPPNRPHLRFAHQYHGIQLSAPLLLAPALPYMTKLSPSLSHCWSSFDFYFGPSRLPLSTLPPAGTKWGLLCAGLSRTCNTPDLLTAVMSLTFTQVLCAIGFEGPSRRSLFRHASTRPPHGRSLHPPEPRRGIWHTTAHPSRMQEQEKPPCRGLVPHYRRSFARLFPRRHCACRSLRAHETQNITHQRGRPSV